MRRAARMLREGATLKAEPCPYCGGVRVMRGGYALCTGCGSEPDSGAPAAAADAGPAPGAGEAQQAGKEAGAGPAIAILEERLARAAAALPGMQHGARRSDLLDEIASLAAAIRSLESGWAGAGAGAGAGAASRG